MRDDLKDLVSLGRGMTVLVACIVQELSKSDPSFEDRFLERLDEAYRDVRDQIAYDSGFALALIASTRSLLTGKTLRGVQTAPFLSDEQS